MRAMTQAARDVLAERRRQIEKEGWTPEHDDQHVNGGLAAAAACYAMQAANDTRGIATRIVPAPWPWARRWWKPKDQRRNLVKAAALILSEIERLDRAAGAKGPVEAAHV